MVERRPYDQYHAVVGQLEALFRAKIDLACTAS
jgi:hypothetical protein